MKYPLNLSDQELVSLYVGGDPEALGALMIRHKDRIFTSIYLIVHSKEVAEDIFQDLFVRIIHTINNGQYKENSKFLAWAIRIGHNLCMDHFRKQKREPVFLKPIEDRDVFENIDGVVSGSDQKIVSQEVTSDIRKMIDLLSEDQRTIIILRHHANLKFREIAKILGISVNTALGRMRYALINLRKIMVQKQVAL